MYIPGSRIRRYDFFWNDFLCATHENSATIVAVNFSKAKTNMIYTDHPRNIKNVLQRREKGLKVFIIYTGRI